MRKYKCSTCQTTTSVIRQRKRQTSIVYYCKGCRKYFSIKTIHIDTKRIMNDHLDGLSFRDLALRYDISPMSAWRICEQELKKLPNNNEFTFQYCDRFSQILVVDGKYFNVVNGNSTDDWVLLWGLDYFRHDIPVISVVPSESYHAWSRFFSYFRIINNRPRLLVCDDNNNTKIAARQLFPGVKIQTCYNHFKENIRRELKVRSDTTYKKFMNRIEDILTVKLNDADINRRLFALFRDYRTDPVCVSVLTNIEKYKTELLAYRGIPQAPVTSNIIEGMNAHIESRLHSIRSFQSIHYAKLWLNGYILKKRFTRFTDCKGKFRYMNGKRGVEMTKKERVSLPLYF